MPNLFLSSDRLYLRPAESTDAALVAACHNDPAVRASMFTNAPLSLEGAAERIRGWYKPGADYIPFVVCLKEDDRPIGLAALVRVDQVSRMSAYSLCLPDPATWGQGYATEATGLMLHYGFEVLNLHRIQLHVWSGNAGAIRAYLRNGFKEEGRLREAMRLEGKWADFLLMGILEEEWRAKG